MNSKPEITVTKKITIRKQAFVKENKGNIFSFYEVNQKELGSGTYGKVYKGINKISKQVRAIKVIAKAKIKNLDRFKTEVQIMKTLDHPNVIKLYEFFEDEANFYLVMEVCTGGELFDRISSMGHFSEKYAAKIFKQILLAINFCHQNKICHRDLKPENFLFETEDAASALKMIDFGLSKIYYDDDTGFVKMKTRAGTPYYIAPEVLSGLDYDQSCDLWSAGVLLYILLCGYPPFYGDTDNDILKSVKKGEFDFDSDEWNDVSDEAKVLIKNLITTPAKRLSAQEALQHPWITHQAPNAKKGELNPKVISKLKNFSKCEKLKKVALNYIALQCSPKEVEELRKIFEQLDNNGDGTISLDELKEGLGDFKGGLNYEEVLLAIAQSASGNINYTEFLAATLERNVYLQEEKLKDAFSALDVDGSGKISAEELKQVLSGEKGSIVDPEEFMKMIQEVDQDGDGEIDYNEFRDMMKRGATMALS